MTKDLVFIASGGRTGTQFLGDRLSEVIADCHSEHEPDLALGLSRQTMRRIGRFGFWHMVAGRALGLTGVRVTGHKLLTGAITEEVAFRRIRRARDGWHHSIPQGLVVESYSRWWMFAGRIRRIWPGAKTVGVIRDPRDWIGSWLRHRPAIHQRDIWFWFPVGALTPAAVGDTEWADRWDGLAQFGRLAWDWRTAYGTLDRAADAGEVRMYRFEDIFGPDPGHIADLVAYVADHGERRYAVGDLGGFTSETRNASRGPRRSWPDWPDADAHLLDAMCGPLMRKYGYGTEPEWTAKVAAGAGA